VDQAKTVMSQLQPNQVTNKAVVMNAVSTKRDLREPG